MAPSKTRLSANAMVHRRSCRIADVMVEGGGQADGRFRSGEVRGALDSAVPSSTEDDSANGCACEIRQLIPVRSC